MISPLQTIILSKAINSGKAVILSGARNPRISLLSLFVLLATTISCPAQKSTPKISGQAIYSLTQQYIAAAPRRAVNSPGHLKAEEFIKAHFAPEAAKGNLEIDGFTANTPIGQVAMRNYIVRYPGKPQSQGKKDGVIVIATHYETNYPLKDINFVGANDGACTTALLIELGRYLRTHPPEGYAVWLVFDDGEEAIQSWTDRDSLYGTKHLAAKWSQDGTLQRIKALMIADMIGAKDLNIDREQNSTPWLLDLLTVAAKNTGHTGYIFRNTIDVEDDHIPFQKRGVPVLDLIDLDYGPPTREHPEGSFHHTDQDTMDKLSPKSLQVSADLVVEMIHLINQH